MKRKKQPDEPEVVRFVNGMSKIWSFSLPQLSEADIRQLHDGIVPQWIKDDIAFWLRDNQKPGDIRPEFQTYEQEAEHERKVG